ncbi:hypothetical protein TNCV_3785811 [Trichonephila clavipes]|nr:hypothetical protein TNCV_3785811 [Trichonephila clavipes]
MYLLPEPTIKIIRRMRTASMHDAFLYRIGVKDSACCALCHQGEMDGDHLGHCPMVLMFLANNSTDANFNCIYASSSLYWAARKLMTEMPKMSQG